MDVQMVALEDKIGDLLPALDGGLVRGDGDQLLDPVHVLAVAQRSHVVDVIGVVIVCKEAAAAVEALHQHALPIHVGKAQRPVDGGAAQLPRPVLHHAEQGGRHLPVVDKVHLREAQAVGAPFVVGLAGIDSADAPHDIAVPLRQPAPGVAILEGRVLAAIPVGQIVVVGGGDKLGHALIQPVGVVHKFPQLRLCRYFHDRNHREPPVPTHNSDSVRLFQTNCKTCKNKWRGGAEYGTIGVENQNAGGAGYYGIAVV